MFGLLIVIVGGLLAGRFVRQGTQFADGRILPEITNPSYVLRGLAVLVVAVFLMASSGAAIREPPLPEVSLTRSRNY